MSKCMKQVSVLQQGGAVTVDCGKCNYCLRARKNDWSFRLAWAMKEAVTAYFVTLTYKPEEVPTVSDGKMNYQTLRRADIKLFHKNLKQAQDRYFEKQGLEKPDVRIKYYTVGEYGTKTGRPHYHLILFNCHPEVKDKILDIWGKGMIKVGDVNGASIAYVAKYIIDMDDRHKNNPIERPFSIMSKGLGENYLKHNWKWHKDVDDDPEDWRFIVINQNGKKQRLPRYYKDKIFTSEEKKYFGEMHKDDDIQRYFEELCKLEKDYPDDFDKRYYEFKRAAHNKIKTKSQDANTL